jgi:hypothetical protein
MTLVQSLHTAADIRNTKLPIPTHGRRFTYMKGGLC